ncbi:MAG: acyl carrier protein [Anaerolineales bacterium]|nr:acyl carrier protein [Anaerolineales bacterium]
MEDKQEKIRSFLLKHIKTQDLKDDVDIFASGYVNSLFAMQLVMYVEGEFKIQLDSDDLNLDNFRTVNSLVELVERKQG